MSEREFGNMPQRPGAEEETAVNGRILYDIAPVGILTYSSTGEVLAANRFLLAMLGSPSLEATKEVNLFAFPNLREAGISHVLKETLEICVPHELETEYVSRWDKRIFMRIVAFPLVTTSGSPERGMAIVQDVSLLKQAEQELKNSEERFRFLADKTPLGMAIVSAGGAFTYVNPAFVALFGYTLQDALTLKEWLTLVFHDSSLREVLHEAIRSGFDSLDKCSELEPHLDMRCKDGSFKKVRLKSFPISEQDLVLVCDDCSQLVLAWWAHRASEAKYQGLLEHLTDFVYTLDPEGLLLSINRAAARSLGYEPEEVIGRSISEIIPPDVRGFIPENLKKVLDEGYAEGLSKYVAKDGDIHYLEYRSVAIRPGDRPHYVVGVARDVTERVTMRRKLQESETKFQLLIESAHDGIIYIDAEGRIQFANPRMKEILKDSHPEGKMLRDYYDAENGEILRKNLEIRAKGLSSTYFASLTDLEGNYRQLVVSGTPFLDEKKNYRGAIGVYTDISELKKLEAQLQQSQKMEAVGTLAGGIAHDFNNILSGVLGYASLLKQLVAPGSQMAHYAEMIEKSAERGAALAGKLLAFSRKGKRFIQSVDVHQVVDEVVEILNHTLDRKITVHTEKNAPTSLIEGDPGQIQQVLMNLCINASDAMPRGGCLAISTGLTRADEAFCQGQESLASGSFLELRVEDTGEGMTEYVMERLFEPFFTTKEEGKGTGLGLSMVYGTVKDHGGTVKASSQIGKGSVFTVLLPLQDAQSKKAEPLAKRPIAYGTGTILVVDDEEIIRQLLTEMLQEMGFRVLSASDGVEALEKYRNNWRAIDLVIMDFIMPRLSGREAFLAMKEINSEVKVILSTGYGRDGAVEDALGQGIVGFVQKPFRAEELADVLASVFAAEQTQDLNGRSPFRPQRW